MSWNLPILNRDRAARWTFGFAFFVFVYRLLTYSLVHQMQQPVLYETDFDYTYWLYHATGIPRLLAGNKAIAWIFDLLLLFFTSYAWVTAGRRRWVVLGCAIGWTLYGLTYNSYSHHHNISIIGMMVLPYAFLVQKEKKFRLLWEGCRYFYLYIFADAFIQKALIRHSLFFLPNGAEFIKTNQALYMVQHPDSLLTGLYAWVIIHPMAAYTGMLTMVLLQGCMIVGFFTRKWDRWLFWIPILFHTVNLLFVDVFFYELLILNLTLLPIVFQSETRANNISPIA
jgi:hypothetical protein